MKAKAIDIGDFWEVVYKEKGSSHWETIGEIYDEKEAKEYAKEINKKQSLE